MMCGLAVFTNSIKKPGPDINRIFKRRLFISSLLMFGLATLAMMPIFGHGLPPMSDAFVHYRWAFGFIEALREGSLYPQWLENPNYGAGSPAMIYYPPLPFYVVAAFHLVTGNILKALAFSCWLALGLSGITMYVFARSALSHRASLLAGALYILAPYHLLDLYQRAALSEFWAFVWVPLVFYAVRRVANDGGWRSVSILAVSYSLLLMTHVLTAFATTLLIPVYALFITRDMRRIGRTAAGLALGIGLSAIFVAPLLLEREYVRVHRMHKNKYQRYFLIESLPDALKTDPLPPGQDPEFFHQQADYFFYEASVLIFVFLFALASISIWKRGQTSLRADSHSGALRAVWIVGLLSLFMTTRLSEPIWRVTPGLYYMQFPFRWLLIASVCMSFLSAAGWSVLAPQGKGRILYRGAIALLLALNLTAAIFAVVRQPRGEQAIPTEVSELDVPEYRPRGWDYKNSQELAAISVSSGQAIAQATDEKGAKQSYLVFAGTESVLRFRTLYFPGWVGCVDGKPVETGPGEQGNIELTVEPGEHFLTLRFEDTWPRTAGKLISALCFLLTVVMLYRTRRSTVDAALLA